MRVPERLPPGVRVDADGLPRPPAPQGVHRLEGRRRFLLRQFVDLDVDDLPPTVRALLLRPVPLAQHSAKLVPRVLRALTVDERQRLANALVARGLDLNRLSWTLNLIGDRALSPEALQALYEEAVHQHELASRPGENFSIIDVTAVSRNGRESWLLQARTDDGVDHVVDLPMHVLEHGDPHSPNSNAHHLFRQMCLRAGFIPILKEPYRGKGFDYFVQILLQKAAE